MWLLTVQNPIIPLRASPVELSSMAVSPTVNPKPQRSLATELLKYVGAYITSVNPTYLGL